jgi:hypothetical protein
MMMMMMMMMIIIIIIIIINCKKEYCWCQQLCVTVDEYVVVALVDFDFAHDLLS